MPLWWPDRLGDRLRSGGATMRRRRRVIVVAVSVVVALAGLAAVIWFVFVPNWRPVLAGTETYGVDVSAHQGEIDWQRVASDGIEFTYSCEGAAAAGIDRGAYPFFSLCAPGADQARNFLRVAPPDVATRRKLR